MMRTVHPAAHATTEPVGAGAPAAGRPDRALAGTLAVLLAVAATKWGAYLGIAPIFPIDVLLALAAATAVVPAPWAGAAPGTGAAGRRRPGAAATALMLYAVLRLLFGAEHDITALRDFAPYGYLFVAFLSARSYYLSAQRGRARTAKLIDAALLFHLCWVLFALRWPGLVERGPLLDATQNLHLFTLRGSTDATVVGATGAVFLMRFLQTGRGRHLVVVVVSLTVVLSTPARAAVLGTAVAFALVCALFYLAPRRLAHRERKLLLAGALPALILLGGLLLPQTAAGSKLLAGIGVTDVRSQVDQSGIGTMRGRSTAWRRVDEYVASSGRSVLGVGFGPDFLGAAGARRPLGNSEHLRSPHNYFVGSYARLGLVGLGLLLALLLAAGREAVRCRRVAATDPLVLFAVIFPGALLASGAFGVELEAPFGAVPFFWCLGIILSRPQPKAETRAEPASA